MHADVVIIGGGTAGCVLAARLSEDPERDVVLLEAGPDYPTIDELPRELADGRLATASHDWGFTAEPDANGRRLTLLRARVTGGCSATNVTYATRGTRADYDAWRDLGNAGWGFDDVLPFFCRAETDADFGADPWHGDAGPLPIRRAPVEEQTELTRAFLDAAMAAGHDPVADLNRPGAVGVGAAPMNTRRGIRQSTALTYLAMARSRANLDIRASSLVDQIVVTDGRARGVRLAGGDGIEADLVIASAGAYVTPAVLLRSGIGDPDALRALGVDVVAALPGVGRNLIEHPRLALDVPIALEVRDEPKFQAIVAWSSVGAADHDTHLLCGGPFARDDGSSVAGISAAFLKPKSRGTVALRSLDPHDAPVIDTRILQEPHDADRLLEGLRAARRIFRQSPLAELATGDELAPAPGIDDDDTGRLAGAIRAHVDTYFHPVGTARMGPDPDDGAVVDAQCRVHGVDSLLVADASVMPDIPSAGTCLPTIMIAERVSDFLRGA